MAYGRLDVYLPGGEFKTYPLTDERISIGRSPGSTIPLDTDSLSRYHASLTVQDGEVFLTDLESINGTFVDGVRLKANSPHVLYGGEEITIGDVRMIYQGIDDAPTRPVLVLEDATRRLSRAELPFYVEIEAPEFPVPPGAHISSPVKITNTGDVTLRFRVEVSGLPEGWARQDRREIEVAPGASGTVVLNFKPRRRSDSRPGDYPVSVLVRLVDVPEMALNGMITLRVLPYSGFGMALEPSARRPAAGANSAPGTARAGAPIRLHLHNQGSAPLPIRLIARDLDEGLHLTVQPAQFVLAPDERAVAQVIARPRRTRLFGDSRAWSFDIVARSGDAAGFIVPVRATIDDRPPLPGWSAFVIGGMGLALVLLAIFLGVVLLQPRTPAPVIDRFAVLNADPAAIPASEGVRAAWQVTHADTIRILIDSLELYRNSAAEGTTALDAGALSGAHTLTLIASGAGGEARAELSISVLPVLTVSRFSYAPRPLLLYVTQTLTLDWAVDGAESTRLDGLADFSFNAPPEGTTFGASGVLTVSGIARAPLTLTLIGEGRGMRTEQRFDLEIRTPQCEAPRDVPLRAAADGGGQVIATIPAGAQVVVDAQDAFGRWLRVQLAGGARGWGERTALTCSGFSPDDLYKAIDTLPPSPALPLPTAQPPPTVSVGG
jgi:hypothetical protein